MGVYNKNTHIKEFYKYVFKISYITLSTHASRHVFYLRVQKTSLILSHQCHRLTCYFLYIIC